MHYANHNVAANGAHQGAPFTMNSGFSGLKTDLMCGNYVPDSAMARSDRATHSDPIDESFHPKPTPLSGWLLQVRKPLTSGNDKLSGNGIGTPSNISGIEPILVGLGKISGIGHKRQTGMPRLSSPVWEGVPHVRSTRDVCGLLVNGVSEGRETYPILQGGVLGASTFFAYI
jgi:hypothetical protein